MMNYDRRTAVEQETPEESDPIVEGDAKHFGELQVAEYLVFLFALDTYLRYLQELKNGEIAIDDLGGHGVHLLKVADRLHKQTVQAFIEEHLPTKGQKTMLARALLLRPSPETVAERTTLIRAALARGGAGTMKGIFRSADAIKEVKTAISAAGIKDADHALDKLAVIPVKNHMIRDWIDKASGLAGKGLPPGLVCSSSQDTTDEVTAIAKERLVQKGADASSDEHRESVIRHENLLTKVETKARETAERTLAVAKQPDVPPKRSEVVGIATAAAVAAVTDPALRRNMPRAFQGPPEADDEQLLAGLSDGKVLVAAGAGAGKSTTLVSRVQYLIEDKKVSPARILVATFNTGAADELKARIDANMGPDFHKGMAIGTMHSLFRRFIRGDGSMRGFGTPEEARLLSDENLIQRDGKKKEEPKFALKGPDGDLTSMDRTHKQKPPNGVALTYAIKAMWKDCGPEGLASMTGFPKEVFENGPELSAPSARQYMENWRGNDIDFKTARMGATTAEELYGSIWMEMYHGLKGDLGSGWKPCGGKFSGAFAKFIKNYRAGDEGGNPHKRLGDADDMIRIFRDILRRNPEAKRAAQGLFDHILVDEAQDLNEVQIEVFDMMTEHITDDKSGKSCWMVGDDKQSIYQFRGARPSRFSARMNEPGWKTCLIQTNYRCEPEIVDAGNNIAAHNAGQIPMLCRAKPDKKRGTGSITLDTPDDYQDGASNVFDEFERVMNIGSKPSKFAVLSRTNAELDAFQDQCIIREIPFVRSKESGFLDSPESKVVLGYMDLALSSDMEEMQEAFANALLKPDRGLFMSRDDVASIVKDTIKEAASEAGMDSRSFNPLDFLTRPQIARKLARKLRLPGKSRDIKMVRDMEARFGETPWFKNKLRAEGYEWKYNENVENLTFQLMGMGKQVLEIRRKVRTGAPTKIVLDSILDDVSAETGYLNRKTGEDSRKTVTLRQQLKGDIAFIRNPQNDGDEPIKVVYDENGMRKEVENDDPEGDAAGLGAVQYLFQIAKKNAKDEDIGIDPANSGDFYRKLDRYKQLAAELQDPTKYPDRLTLSTVHSVKGKQWDNVALCMSPGFFPGGNREERNLLEQILKSSNKEDPRPPEQKDPARARIAAIKEDPMQAERNLAYVGITRAKTNLHIIASQEKVREDKRTDVGKFVREAQLDHYASIGYPNEISGEPVVAPTGVAPEIEPVKTAAYEEDLDIHLPPEAFATPDSYDYRRTT